MSTPVTEPTLETEMWVSFVSLLHSYAAACSLNLKEPLRVEEAGTSFAILARDARLEIQFDTGSSAVNWRLHTQYQDPTTGSFKFLSEGTVAIGQTIKDLDQVAIEFVAAVIEQSPSGKGTQ